MLHLPDSTLHPDLLQHRQAATPCPNHDHLGQKVGLGSAAAPDPLRQQPGTATLETTKNRCCVSRLSCQKDIADWSSCLTCRKRKTRCAGERPLCSTCTKNGHKCLGYPEDAKKDDGDASGRPDDHDLPEIDHVEDSSARHVRIKAPPDVPPLQLSEVPFQTKTPEPTQDAPSLTPRVAQFPLENYLPTSPSAIRRTENHRVPYFRYFGPTAIVPGFKQMVVSVRDRRRSTAGSASGTSPLSVHSGALGSSSTVDSEVIIEDLPAYDPSDPTPVHPLIISLIETFFLQMGSNYPFLKKSRFLRMIHEKRVEPILVDSICALAARFSDSPLLTSGNDKMPRTERGATFAQRARQATVDTFPCPSVGAVQACLLMAYEGFGASQDSALWMYLGLAIRMAVDLGLQKEVGVQYQGEKDPLYRSWNRTDEDSPEAKEDASPPNPEDAREVVQERMDTFWAIFILDRVISSGTGRPVTFRDDDFELTFPEPTIDAVTKWPALFPMFLQIIHLYGRVSDVLNKIRDAQDLNKDTWAKLADMEHELTRLYKSWDWRLQFNVSNFKAYLGAGHGTTFILLHFWFHALLIILHQPMLLTPFAELRSELQLLQDSRELSMSSAKTICDILSFADLIDPKSFVGNPFTSQPIYIAACAFLIESSANASESPSRASSPPPKRPELKGKSRHSLLASAASQNYQRCYSSLQQIQMYWGGVKYILTALDQKAKGIWDCETYTSEEYESTKRGRRDSRGAMNNPFRRFESQVPKASGPPIAWSLSGTANSPNSSLTLMYQNLDAGGGAHAPQTAQTSTPPGNMVFDPIRQSLPEATTLLAPAYQANAAATRPRPGLLRRQSTMSTASGASRPTVKFVNPDGEDGAPKPPSRQSDGEGLGGSPSSTVAAGPAAVSGPPAPHQGYYPPTMAYPMQWTPAMGNIDAITFDSQDIDIGALGLQQPELMGPWLELIPSEMLGLFESQEGQGPQ